MVILVLYLRLSKFLHHDNTICIGQVEYSLSLLLIMQMEVDFSRQDIAHLPRGFGLIYWIWGAISASALVI